MRPLFFSVSSRDINFAEEIWRAIPGDWAYLYSKNGRHGAKMWDEIALEELPKAKVVVIFWSANFPNSPGCVREIQKAALLYEAGALTPAIIRLDDYPLHWRPELDHTHRPVFDALKPLTEYRASDANASVEQAKKMIVDVAEPLLQSDHPRMPRHDLVRGLRQSLQKDRFTLIPACWVSGFNGVGRESLVRDLNRDLVPNGRGIVIEVSEATLPRQLLLRIESEALGADHNRLAHINETIGEEDVNAVAVAVERVAEAGNFLILRHGRIVQEAVELPEWLDDVAKALKPGTRPKLFIVSQLPLTGERLVQSRDYMVPFRVPTLDEDSMTDFCYQLIGHFDGNPTRWQDEVVTRIVRATGGTIGFLVSLIRSAARIENFDDIDAMLAQEGDRMAEAMTAYLRWAFSRLRGDDDAQKALLFLNNVSPCHIMDLEAAVRPNGSMLRVLGRLIDLGLVERETDDLYRLTPLLANRMNANLIRPELIKWVSEAQRSFASQPFEASTSAEDGGHEYIRLEAKIQAALLSNTECLPNSLGAFVSAAHWFQAGIRLYHARKWKPAYRLLKKAHEHRLSFRDASRMEIDRYYCLSATRMRKFDEADQVITRLKSDHRSKPIAAFLKADLHEHKREFREAIDAYEAALDLNRDKDRRREFIYRPLIRCILDSHRPDFARAKSIAQDYVALKRTVFSLASRARVYLRWKFQGPSAGREVPPDIDDLYNYAMSDLEKYPGAGAAPFELYAEEARFTGDFEAALEHMDRAIEMDTDRFQLRDARWRLMAKSGRPDMAAKAIKELDNAKNDPRLEAVWPAYVHALADTYVHALMTVGQPIALANNFAPELQAAGELGQIIARARRDATRR